MKTNCCWVYHKWVTIQNQTVILKKSQSSTDLSNYAAKKKLDHTTGVDTFDLAAEKDFIALKALKLKNWKLINWLMFQLVWII